MDKSPSPSGTDVRLLAFLHLHVLTIFLFSQIFFHVFFFFSPCLFFEYWLHSISFTQLGHGIFIYSLDYFNHFCLFCSNK